MKLVYSIFIVFFSVQLLAQKHANNWIFSNDNYLSFNSGVPEFLTPPPPTNCIYGNSWAGLCQFSSSMRSGTSISDSAGNLLLFSEGEVLWNSSFDTINYGDVFLGDIRSNQCLLIPRPNYPDRFYLITTRYVMTNNGARWSEIDINANNGIGSTIPPWNNILVNNSTQKVTAVYHANGKDIWLMLHEFNSDAFYAFLVTSNGISTNPVISNIGAIHQNQANSQGADTGSAGEMKFSTNGKKIAVAIRGLDLCEIFDFDNELGVVLNPITIGVEGAESVEFSSNGTVVYIGNNPSNIFSPSNIFQFDLLAGDSLAIVNSIDSLINPVGQFICFLQLAPNGIIYHANGHDHISSINLPNLIGSNCNYSSQSLSYPFIAYCGAGAIMLPNFFRSALDRNLVF